MVLVMLVEWIPLWKVTSGFWELLQAPPALSLV
jgi:hypothetical protein